jgi:DNA-binding MarR family transcriptional regulator
LSDPINRPKGARVETGTTQRSPSECQLRHIAKPTEPTTRSLDECAANGPVNLPAGGTADGAIPSADQRPSTRNVNAGKIRDIGKAAISEPLLREPDPRLLRRIIRNRQLRARHFDQRLFADPVWNMLLELSAARAENVRISVTSLCIASDVPKTTALRWIDQMTREGFFERSMDTSDRRRTYITLTEKALNSMALYFAGIAESVTNVI